jgi:hypothetical protein
MRALRGFVPQRAGICSPKSGDLFREKKSIRNKSGFNQFSVVSRQSSVKPGVITGWGYGYAVVNVPLKPSLGSREDRVASVLV